MIAHEKIPSREARKGKKNKYYVGYIGLLKCQGQSKVEALPKNYFYPQRNSSITSYIYVSNGASYLSTLDDCQL